MRDIFGDLVFTTVIHRDVRVAESPSAGEPVVTYAPRCKAAADYRALASEILTGTPVVTEAPESRLRRGIQKHLTTLFDGVWIPKRVPRINPASIEST